MISLKTSLLKNIMMAIVMEEFKTVITVRTINLEVLPTRFQTEESQFVLVNLF